MRCTWVDCTNQAKHRKIARDGDEWAHLCDLHEQEYQQVVAAPLAGRILSTWIKAQGGAKVAAARMGRVWQ